MPPTVTLLHGDSLTLLADPRGLRSPEGKLLKADALITDPPYNVSLDGERDWDDFQTDRFARSNEEFRKWTGTWARDLMREVLQPGAIAAVFSAHKTVHAPMFGLEDAGFTILDVKLWLYATGQVKHKQKLKPAYEPIILARRKSPQGDSEKQVNDLFKRTGRGHLHTQDLKAEEGRHPLNVEVGDPAVLDLDEDLRQIAKFLYVAKPTREERDYGCEALEIKRIEGGLAGNMGKSSIEARNFHPTVKPISLMRRLVRLLTPPGATIIDPFMGSGTTGIAAVLEGRNFIGIEREADFHAISAFRIATALKEAGDEVQAERLTHGITLPQAAQKEGGLGSDGRSCPCGHIGFLKGAKNCHKCGSLLKVETP